jgi:hypothetical protein
VSEGVREGDVFPNLHTEREKDALWEKAGKEKTLQNREREREGARGSERERERERARERESVPP